MPVPELKFDTAERPSRNGIVTMWLPRLGVAAAFLMIGAALIWVFLLHAPGNAPIPLLVLVALIVVGLQARRT